jgi:hypothetical protein
MRLIFRPVRGWLVWCSVVCCVVCVYGGVFCSDLCCVRSALKKEVSEQLRINNEQYNMLYSLASFAVVVVTWIAGFLVDK